MFYDFWNLQIGLLFNRNNGEYFVITWKSRNFSLEKYEIVKTHEWLKCLIFKDYGCV